MLGMDGVYNPIDRKSPFKRTFSGEAEIAIENRVSIVFCRNGLRSLPSENLFYLPEIPLEQPSDLHVSLSINLAAVTEKLTDVVLGKI